MDGEKTFCLAEGLRFSFRDDSDGSKAIFQNPMISRHVGGVDLAPAFGLFAFLLSFVPEALGVMGSVLPKQLLSMFSKVARVFPFMSPFKVVLTGASVWCCNFKASFTDSQCFTTVDFFPSSFPGNV